jgi:hypothetical protein
VSQEILALQRAIFRNRFSRAGAHRWRMKGHGCTRIHTDLQRTIRVGALPARRAQRAALPGIGGGKTPQRLSVSQGPFVTPAAPRNLWLYLRAIFEAVSHAPGAHLWRWKTSWRTYRVHLCTGGTGSGRRASRSSGSLESAESGKSASFPNAMRIATILRRSGLAACSSATGHSLKERWNHGKQEERRRGQTQAG